jgi:hypothetical protein
MLHTLTPYDARSLAIPVELGLNEKIRLDPTGFEADHIV